jgi:NADPH:quinone reductase-like Zn-dependent oxidoreductase
METMNAAVVTSFDEPPHYQVIAVPEPVTENEILVDVLAVGLHPRVRSGATGSHYTSTGQLPMVPGIDGVGQRADGKRIYFVSIDDRGSMADQAVVDVRRTIELPDHVDVVNVAAAMNPAMSAWVALRRRVPLEVGQSVLVLGATGNAGTTAVQVAKRLGAARVVGAGRDRARLDALRSFGADEVIQLSNDAEATKRALGAAAADVDVVIDYLWGQPAHDAMMALVAARSDRSRALSWIQIGSMAGPTIELPSVALRSANLRLLGNGQGAVSAKVYLAELPSLVDEIDAGTITVHTVTQPLAHVEMVWARDESPGERIVFVP